MTLDYLDPGEDYLDLNKKVLNQSWVYIVFALLVIRRAMVNHMNTLSTVVAVLV